MVANFKIIGVIIILVLLVLYFIGKKNSKVRETYRDIYRGNDFKIFNYTNKPIRVDVSIGGRRNITIVRSIPARSSHGLKMKVIEKYLVPENTFSIYTQDTLFSTNRVATPDGTTIKSLHIGMITSRWVGANGDFNIGSPGLNAVQGLPYMRIHNFTDQMLSLNNNINIAPGGMLRYQGRDHFGVRLGTVFKDVNGVFPEFVWSIPATDLYYGVVSDIQQPSFGGFQLTSEFDDDPSEPHYLLENGWMGGDARGDIPIGFLPLEGPPVKRSDRWGNV